jgi:hypothetical protein
MTYDVHQEKNYSQDARSVFDAALKSAEKLGGKMLSSSPNDLRFEVKYDKTILGTVLGDRTQMTCVVQPQENGSKVVLDAYPLDAVGRKLMFGARKGVTQTVINWFTEYLENNLK